MTTTLTSPTAAPTAEGAKAPADTATATTDAKATAPAADAKADTPSQKGKTEEKRQEQQPRKSGVAQALSGDTEQKADGDKGEAAKSGAPEKYDLKAPEGHTMAPATQQAFEAVAKKHGLSNDAAQDFVNQLTPVLAKAELARVDAQWNEWAETSKKSEGEAFDANSKLAAKAAGLGTPGFRKLLEGPMGDHPDVRASLVAIGKSITADSQAAGSRDGGAPVTQTTEQKLADRYGAKDPEARKALTGR